MVKLQRHKAYTYKTDSGETIEHYKHIINIPEDILTELGWTSGISLTAIPKGNSLILKPIRDHNDSSNSSSR
jgi:hypothetical protein